MVDRIDRAPARTVRFQNPVVPRDAPDPGVTLIDDVYVRSHTGGGDNGKFPISTSRDLVHWKPAGFIFPKGRQPKWTTTRFWAPEIHAVGDHYVAYYTAANRAGQLSIGAARASSPTGPFVDLGRPLIPGGPVGVIDPHFFKDKDGQQYLYWKSDGNAVGQPTWLWGQKLSKDGLKLVGEPRRLLRNDRPSEHGVIEAPWMNRVGGRYYLTFSFGVYSNATYGGGFAVGRSPLGPFKKADRAFLHSGDGFTGPGHFSIVPGRAVEGRPDRYYLVGHAQRGNNVSNTPRMDVVAELTFGPNGPSVNHGRGTVPRQGRVRVPAPGTPTP